MATRQAPTSDANQAQAQSSLQDAMARMKEASDRHAAMVSVMSRLGVSPQERRLAQSESKKVERQLADAKRLLQEAQAAARTAKVRSAP